jgi:predicted NAD-dependent protein-ADP-ribosyltransferase YbiA (DUF1768 family)
VEALLRDGLLTLSAETEQEQELLRAWASGHVLTSLTVGSDGTLQLRPAGPLNITYDTTLPPLQLLSNLAATPFQLEGQPYASVEGFWQGLKFRSPRDRARIAQLSGHEALRAGRTAPRSHVLTYEGQEVHVGTHEHWALMERALRAKFTQCAEARAALLSTGTQILEHRVKTDSLTIPGVILAELWMRLRRELSTP